MGRQKLIFLYLFTITVSLTFQKVHGEQEAGDEPAKPPTKSEIDLVIKMEDEENVTNEPPILVEPLDDPVSDPSSVEEVKNNSILITSTTSSTTTTTTSTTVATPVATVVTEKLKNESLNLIDPPPPPVKEGPKMETGRNKTVNTNSTTEMVSTMMMMVVSEEENNFKTQNITDTLKNILENYDKRLRPDFFGPPTQVEVTILVNSISSIDEVNMEFQVDFYLRQSWRDRRLAFDLGDKVTVMGLSSDLMDQIWRPDTYFANEKKAYVHSATVPNRFIRLFSDGRLTTSTRLTLTASCAMNLALYPMDHQICWLKMGSYGYNTANIFYNWANYNQTRLNSKNLPQFLIKGVHRSNRTATTLTEAYSILEVQFLFVRSLSYYVTQIYVPSFLVVTIAYFALWIGRENPAPRLSLGVTTVLTMTTIYMANSAKSPPINYVKALDIYLGICFIGVFTTLLESVTICYVIKKGKSKRQKESKKKKEEKNKAKNKKPDHLTLVISNDPNKPNTDEDEDDPNDKKRRKSKKELNFYVSKMEVGARILFPICFLSFNLIYWAYYLKASELDYPENFWSPFNQ